MDEKSKYIWDFTEELHDSITTIYEDAMEGDINKLNKNIDKTIANLKKLKQDLNEPTREV